MRQNKPAGENPTAPRRAMGSTGRKVEWLNGADLLIVRADRKEPLFGIPLRLATEVAAEGYKAHGWDAVHRSGAQGR